MRNPPADLRLYYVQRPAPHIPELAGAQAYFPALETLFPSLAEQSKGSPTLAASELVVDISGGVATVEHIVEKTRRQVPIWQRKVHLLEPVDAMEGTYVMPPDGALPSFRNAWQQTLRKINDPYNEAYTDAVFACMASRLAETGKSPHWCRFFGTYNGRAATYKYTITDDMPDIEGEDWFREGLKTGEFEIIASDPYDPDVRAPLTHPWEDGVRKIDMSVGETDDEESGEDSSSDGGDDEDEVGTPSVTSLADLEDITEGEGIEEGEPAVIVRPRIRLSRISGSMNESEENEEEDDLDYHAILKNFPVQLTFLERCDGTMDDLMEDEIAETATDDMKETKEERWTAWIFQVVAALAVAQQTYDFVHNDLHTNNVMWCGTGETHLYYHVQGAAGGDRYYRVPTYGRLFKIIDFGRATFRPPVLTGGPLWLPDAYAPHADAGGQYNCGQYFEQGKPKIQPNKSFDLCRLAVAMLETLWEEKPEPVQPQKVLTREAGRIQMETKSPLWNLLWLWLTDKDGKNILRSPDDEERFPQFELYCAIARTITNAVPSQQLTLPLFDNAFRCRKKDVPADVTLWKLQGSQSHK